MAACSSQQEQLNGFQFWLAGFVFFLFLIGPPQRAKIYFSPLNSPFWPAKYATMPDEMIIIELLLSTPKKGFSVTKTVHWEMIKLKYNLYILTN